MWLRSKQVNGRSRNRSSVSAHLIPRAIFDETMFLHVGKGLDQKCSTMPLRPQAVPVYTWSFISLLNQVSSVKQTSPGHYLIFKLLKGTFSSHCPKKQTFRIQNSSEIIIFK